MSKKIAFDVKTLILCAIIIVGLVLTIVGFVGNFLKADGQIAGFGGASTVKLSDLDKDFEGFTVTNIFAWVTFRMPATRWLVTGSKSRIKRY